MKRMAFNFYRLFLAVMLIVLGIYAERINFIEYVTDPYEYPEIIRAVYRHFYLVFISMLFATTIGISAGIILTRKKFKKFAGYVMYVLGLGQTIPSLAILAIMISFLGIGVKTAIFALTVYSILPIARNTLVGITAVPSSIIDAAKGMGMPPWKILLEVEIPNSMMVIITGFRVALVINIGTAALSYLVGGGGLGDFIFTGISLMQTEKLLAGAIPTALMALIGDQLCEMLNYLLVSKGLRVSK